MHIAGQRPCEMALRLGEGRTAPGGDDVHDRLGLRQIDAAVQESPLREFSPLRQNRPRRQRQRQGLPERLPAAVDLDLHHILAGIGMGPLHIDAEPLIHKGAVPHDVAVAELLRLRRAERAAALHPENAVSHISRTVAADADDADAPFPGRRGDGGNGCFFVHSSSLYDSVLYSFLYYTIRRWEYLIPPGHKQAHKKCAPEDAPLDFVSRAQP